MKRVVWISTTALERTPKGYTSSFASLRYRMAIPAAALARLGWSSQIRTAHPSLLDEAMDVAVIGKILYPPADLSYKAPPFLQLVTQLKAKGVKIVADFCDLTRANRGPVDITLAKIADAITVSTPALLDAFRAEISSPIFVVADPVEGNRGEPKAPGVPPKLLWFGHYFPPVLEWLKTQPPVNLTVVTYASDQRDIFLELSKLKHRSTFRPWSVATTFTELRACDAVVIPQDPRAEVKSANRFTESLWAGRFVLANPIPSYMPFANCGWVGDIAEGLAWLKDHPQDALDRIRRGQELVARDYSPEAIGRQWERALDPAP